MLFFLCQTSFLATTVYITLHSNLGMRTEVRVKHQEIKELKLGRKEKSRKQRLSQRGETDSCEISACLTWVYSFTHTRVISSGAVNLCDSQIVPDGSRHSYRPTCSCQVCYRETLTFTPILQSLCVYLFCEGFLQTFNRKKWTSF